MAIPLDLSDSSLSLIRCVDMHTSGEPSRILTSGYPPLNGSLLVQRDEARRSHDTIRKRLMLEPRGHADMYGAILRQRTELVDSGEADIGVLFTTNEGYSTMCGHATIALGRFLVDTKDTEVFPNRHKLKYDQKRQVVELKLHAPCGVVDVEVPVVDSGKRSDPSRPVAFLSVPSFATALNVEIPIPENLRWSQLGQRASVRADFCYGGAFSCIVSPKELGFPEDVLRVDKVDIDALSEATRKLKIAANENKALFKHKEHEELSFLYTIIVTDSAFGACPDRCVGAETGLCFFDDQQIDRSPTGSATAARVALACAKGQRKAGESWAYHSLVSKKYGTKAAFIGTPIDKSSVGGIPQYHINRNLKKTYRVKVEGYAYYTGEHTFIVEGEDYLKDDGGFTFKNLGN